MKRLSIALKLVIPIVLATPLACQNTTMQSPDGQAMAGLYSAGFEVSSFKPCDVDEAWWVEAGPEALGPEYERLVTQPYEPVYLRARGTMSELGQYGHLGSYDREFRITEILEIRERRGDECPF